MRFLWRLALGTWCFCNIAVAQTNRPTDPPEWILNPRGNFEGHTARPLRYTPDGTDFVITNGAEFFNRPLYCNNTAFRIDCSDRPEFSLYLPGRGGNVRFGIKTPAGIKWLNDAEQIVTRYRPGSMIYEIKDPLIGTGTLKLIMLPLSERKGIITRAELRGTMQPVELLVGFGGANGERFPRNGDIGCMPVPASEAFQLKPEQSRGDVYTLATNSFDVRSPRVNLSGVLSGKGDIRMADGEKWNSPAELLAAASESNALPVLLARVQFQPDAPVHFALVETATGTPSATELPQMFEAAEERRRSVARRVVVETPDPFINAAAAAICVAGDGIWDEATGTYMHGAVAWRSRLLGWRGPYTGDALGWHDRARRHFTHWASQQVKTPIPEMIPPADPTSNLSRNEPALHSNGTMSRSHYDMNLVYIDALFRHFLWTGDLEFAREVWPVIERHLAWERRLFRREFERRSPSPLNGERAGVRGESLIGRSNVTAGAAAGSHPSPSVPLPVEGRGRSATLDSSNTSNDNLPLYEAYAAIWASDDMQYHGGGVTHTSAYNHWHNKMAASMAELIGEDGASYEREADLISRAMREFLWLPDRGWFAEWKDYLGLQLAHPNPGLWTFYHTIDSDAATPFEAWQMTRFVDTQIAHIPVHGPGAADEGLYTLPTTSWMPYTWSLNNVVMAEVVHTSLACWQAGRPDEAFRIFKGALLDSMFMGLCPGNVGMTTHYDMARGEAQRDFGDAVGISSRTIVEGLFGVKPDVLQGELKVRPGLPAGWNHASIRHPNFSFNFRRDGLTETFAVEPDFAKAMALRLQVPALRDAVESVTVNGQAATWKIVADSVGSPRVEVLSPAAARHEVVVRWKGESPSKAVALGVVNLKGPVDANFGSAGLTEIADPQKTLSEVTRRENGFLAGAVGKPGHRTVFAKLKQGELNWWQPVTFEIHDSSGTSAPTDWRAKLPATTRFDAVDISSSFNDSVSQIFQNEYLTPRSPFCSLAIPKQGIGSWCHYQEQFDVDDSGLRAVAATNGGKLMLPNGVPFETPGEADARNIVFTSQWDNYPAEVSVPLSGKAKHAYLLMAGSSNPMQSRFDNGEIVVTYADGTTERLPLHNPTNWWPIDQDYFIDDYAFRRPGPIPPRVDLKTGKVRVLGVNEFEGKGGKVPGGAATVLDIALNPEKELKSLTVRALANEVVVGLMAATLVRP